MKADTRNGYLERISLAIKKVVRLIDACEVGEVEIIEKYKKLFEDAMGVQSIIMDGENTVFVSNKLHSFETRLATIMDKGFIPDGAMDEPALPEGSIGKIILELIESAQTALMQAYGKAIEFNIMAADVAAVRDIEVKAKALSTLMQDVSRVKGFTQ